MAIPKCFTTRRPYLAINAATCLTLSACGATTLELQQATNPMGDNIPKLLSAQIFHNVIAKTRDENALPAEMVVGSGSAQISNQLILPMVTANLTSTIFRSLGLQNQNQWQQSWSISAVTDVGDLQRLDALYRYAIEPNDNPRIQDENKEPQSATCAFVQRYSQAVIAAGSQPSIRLWDTAQGASGDATLSDYNAPPELDFNHDKTRKTKPSSRKSASPPSLTSAVEASPPKVLFGPPATLPIPPLKAIVTCFKTPSASYSDLEANHWPVPLPRTNFIKMDTSGEGFKPIDGFHEMRAFYVKPTDFERFQLWVAGATYNTVSGGKSAGSSPSKGISGSNG